MHKRQVLARGSVPARHRPRPASELGLSEMRALLVEVRAQLEREFSELFESGSELPPGLKESVESAIDRIGVYLRRLQRGDPLVSTELQVLCGTGEAMGERLLESLLLDATVDGEFRGPGLLIHGARPRSASAVRLAALRHDVERRGTQAKHDLESCASVIRLAIALGRARLAQLQERYDKEPERLTYEVARRVRARQNPLRMIGEEMNEIVRAAAQCLVEDEGEPTPR
jgi:hypothetical protein